MKRHPFYLRVTSANYQTTDIGLYVSVTQSGSGSVIFKVSDIYTGALDDNNDIIQGLSGARIKVQNEEVLTVEQTVTTDGLGEAFFEDLPAGRYKCRITADSHQEYIGRLWIKPGITMNEEVFLDYNLVTVEWAVNEITIEDRYEIVLKATYQTDVPAPVVIADPLSMTLPEMEAGDVFNSEFTLTNYGLIRAEEMTFSIPADDQFFSYQLLAALPESLEAKQYVTIPYRVTCLQSPSQEDEGSGGGCVRYDKCVNIGYKYVCINGVITRSSLQHCWSYTEGECSGGSVYHGGGGGGGSWGVGGGGSGGGSGSSPAPTPTSIEGGGCLPDPPRGGGSDGSGCGSGGGDGNGGGGDGSGCDSGGCPGEKDTNEGQCQVTGSGVDLLMREYNRSRTDLSVKVPGGNILAQRWYYDDRWWLSHIDGKLEFIWSPLGDQIDSIELNRVVYEGSSVNPGLYIQGTNRITKTADGYHWTNKRGAWREFDESGRIVSYGSRKGIISKLLYEEGEDGPLIGATDRNDNQALWYEYNGDGLVSAVYDTENRRVEYEYANSLLTLVRDVLGRETGFVYDDEGRIITVTEPGNRQYTITYNAVGLLSSVVDSAGDGYFFEFDYDKAKREYYAQTRSSSGMIKEAWYDRDGDTKNIAANGRTLKDIQKDGRNLIVIDEKGNTIRKEYDEWDNLTKVLYPDGSEVTHEYDLRFNKKSRTTDERGVLTEYEYDDTGNLTRRIEASGTAHERITEYTYDSDGNLLTTKRLADGNTTEALTTMTYDAPGNMTLITDPEGNMTAFTSHDVMGNVLTKIDAGSKEWTYQYDAAGRLRTITDPLNNITGIFYDERGNKIRQVDAEGKETTYEYDNHDNMIKRTDALGNETLFEYNTDNKMIKQIDPEAKEVHYEYDSEGRLTRTIDGNGNEIVMEYEDDEGCSSCSGNTSQVKKITYPTFAKEFSYDERGRKTQEKDILSETEEYVTQFGYDLSGNLLSRIDKESKTTSYLYDDLGRLSQVRDPMNQDTHYVYDNRDNLIELTDANGRTTWFEYDGNNRLKKEIRPMTQETTYQYDGAGNLVEKIDSKNQKTEYVYDDAGRLVEIRYFNPGDHVNPVKTVVFTYDKVGNLKTYDDGVTSALYTYDDVYRKTSETVDYGAFQKTLSYAYYKNGLKETFTGPDSITYAYAYDGNNQIAGVQIPNVGSVTISEYQWNRPASMSLPGGSTKQFIYDPLMRVNSITAKDPGQNILMNYQYNYDNMDNINAKTTEHGDYQYGYDDLYRLNNVDNPTQDDEGFTYDPVGNRLTAEDVAGTWSYNQNNELQSYGDVSYVYDDNGNMTQKTDGGVVTNYIYNQEDRLTEVRDGSDQLIASYYYDPFGRRLWKGVSGVRTYFHYADEGLVGEYDSNGTEIKTYGYKPGSTWTTDPLFMKVGTEYYFYHNDHLGTPQKLTSVNGAVVWSAKYESFGKVNVDVETVENNLRFPGQYFDQETGLQYNFSRYYDSNTGRYLRIDPIGILNSEGDLYQYALNNPVKLYDNYGLWPEEDCEKCQEWLTREKDTSWTKDLSKCPCKRPPTVPALVAVPGGTTWIRLEIKPKYHPGAYRCVRSKPNKTLSAQQCCYDFNDNLITWGPGAGTPDKKSAPSIDHIKEDVDPWYICGGWEKYNKARPPDNRNNCPMNPPAS